MKSKTEAKKFSAREVGEALNNSLSKCLNPASLTKPLDDARLRKIRTFGEALTKVTFKYVEESLLAPEELVAIYAGAALFAQLKYVMRTDKMPLAIEAAAMVTKPFDSEGSVKGKKHGRTKKA